MEVLNAGPSTFGMCMGAMSLAYIIGAMVGSRFTARVGMDRTLRYGLISVAICCAVIFMSISMQPESLPALVIPFLLLFTCQGLVNPTSMAGAVKNHADKAATASGISSSIAMAIGGLTTMVTSVFYTGTALSLCVPVFIAIFIAVLCYPLIHLEKVPVHD